MNTTGGGGGGGGGGGSLKLKIGRKKTEIDHTHTLELALCPSISSASYYGFSDKIKILFTAKQDDTATIMFSLLKRINNG